MTLLAFWNALLQTSFAHAQDAPEAQAPASTPAASSPRAEGTYDAQGRSALSTHLADQPAADDSSGSTAQAAPGALDDVDRELAALPSGGGEVSAQAAALPSGPATQLGMGESFTMQLSTGTAGYSVPISLPTARGGVQPRLDLSYSAAGGFGLAGVGWSLGASAISRQSDRGTPRYDDRASFHPEQDRFVFGGMELVPICTVSGSTCMGMLPGEVMPAWASGWQYFRARIEGGYLRFFWSPNHRTWRAQGKDGTNLELGVPLDGTGYEGALERNPDAPAEIFRWHLVRQYDSQGGANAAGSPTPVNVIVYRHLIDGDSVYLSDLYDTPPASNPTTTNLALYAHHTAIRYEARPDPVTSYRSGWLVEYGLRVEQVDVTSKPFGGGTAVPRQLLRRYHLQYDPESHRSLLTAVQLEGRCAAPVQEDAGQKLPASSCPRLPAIAFEYQRITGQTEPLRDAQGYAFDPFDTTVRELASSPPHSLDEPRADLTDVNADGLPDLLVTEPGAFQGRHGLYLNGLSASGTAGFGDPTQMVVEPAADVTHAGVLSLASPVVAALDLDGDGIVNLVHMPQARRYSVFSPEPANTAATRFKWVGREVLTASQQDVKIDFTGDSPNTRVIDVNGDGLVDIVYSSATELQTFFALGRYPGGDDQFGQGSFTGAASGSIGNEPSVHCIPWSSTPVRFSNPDTRLADMNGDGLVDFVRVRSGQVLYWPGRGNGFWGTGDRDDCAGAGFAEGRHIAMYAPPNFGTQAPGTLLLSDVNGDGLSDMVEIRNQDVDVYLNDNGVGFTQRTLLTNTPFRPNDSNYVRLTDIDGSGTPDILWGRAREYRYIDLTGGKTPHLLVKVKNGLGKTVDIEYASATELMLQAAAAGTPWQTRAPMSSAVVVRTTTRDNLEVVGRPGGAYVTEYAYRDPVYEGRQREFRGFREATVRSVGDSNSPTSLQRTVFHLGECPERYDGTFADVCTPAERWQDNWREALKGLPVISETFDENGVYLTTDHTTYEMRQLYTGLDGRRVVMAVPMAKDTYLYDTAAFTAATSTVSLPEVQVNLGDFTLAEQRSVTLRASAGTARLRSETLYDNFGNVTDTVRHGCVSGCPNGPDETLTAHSDFVLPAGDGSGWLWREQRGYVTGSIQTARRSEQVRNYNAQGNLEESYAVLSGTLPLDRFHAAGGAIAPAPSGQSGGQSAPVQILSADPSYDSFGHVTFARGPNGRCTASVYDTDYAQLPVTARTYVGTLDTATNCGATAIAHSVTYDRGLEAVLDSLDARNQPSRYAYDGFGRLSSSTFANPAQPGVLSPLPSMTVYYELPQNADSAPYSLIGVSVQNGPDPSTDSTTGKWFVSDGLGRTVMTLADADPSAGDAGQYIVEGDTLYDSKGAVARAYDPWFLNGPYTFDMFGTSPYKSQEYDAFGRPLRSYGYDRGIEALVAHHALETDVYDAADVLATTHQNTFSAVISDGHGRGVRRSERIKVGSQIELHVTLNDYLPTGQLSRVVQRRTDSLGMLLAPEVVRWMKYDSLGRMVLNVEPSTSTGFNPDPNTSPASIKAYRYAYNDAGDLVGVSDARGCGSNYHYDAAGRMRAEDRSPCTATQAVYTAPNLTTGDGTESFLRYDSADPDNASITASHPGFAIDTNQLLGRLVSVSSLGAKSVYRYDALGRAIGSAVRVQKPGAPASTLTSRYAPRWYARTQTLDALDRAKTITTGVTTPELLGGDGTSELRFSYSLRGTVSRIDSSYGVLLARQTLLADGTVQSFRLGDAAGTERFLTFDGKRRVSDAQTYRANLPLWSNPAGTSYTPPAPTDDPTKQLLLEDVQIGYDVAGNITSIDDQRLAGDWPATAKPVSRTFAYDDLYRLIRATYSYPGTTDTWRSPYHAENSDATRPQPIPQVSFTNRVAQQEYAYDWLGNISRSTDDAQGFWDRSTGDRTHGSAGAGPHRASAASNRTLAPTSARKGDASVGYDAAGNTTGLILRRDGACLPASASCWQRFEYQWDEVGQLARARRWNLSATERTANGQLAQAVPARAADADLQYGYDHGGGRVLKSAITASGPKHTVYVFKGYELRSADWSGSEYAQTAQTVSLRLGVGPVAARVIYGPADMPTVSGSRLHVFFELSDQVGSSTAIIDRETSELVEHSTYQAYGAAETDYRPNRWRAFREAYKFADKEEDIEVGLSYFGARYYSPYLATWLSPDPVTIHQLGSDPNPYAYVHGRPIIGVDPDGRLAFLVVLVIAVAVSAAISAGTSVAVQTATVGFNNVNWGFKGGVLGAAAIGAVAGAASCGTAGFVAGAMASLTGSAATGALMGGIVGGAAAGAAGYGTGAMIGAYNFDGGDMLMSMAGGALGGLVGGTVNSALNGASQWTTALVSGGVSGGTDYVFQGLTTNEWGWKSLAFSVGVGLAGAAASTAANDAFGPAVEESPAMGPRDVPEDLPVEITGGNADQRAKVLEACRKAFSYDKGQELLDLATSYEQQHGQKLEIKINDVGDNSGIYNREVNIDPNMAHAEKTVQRFTNFLGFEVNTSPTLSLERALVHEMGHMLTGARDNGIPGMNVTNNENPWAKQAGLAPRIR